MSGEVHYFGYVRDAQLVNRKLQAHIRSMEGKRFEVTLRERRNYRTDPQNRAFHGPVLRPITSELRRQGVTGFDGRSLIRESEAKEMLKFMFLRREIINPNTGEVVTLVGETHKLTKSEMADFMTQCIQYAEDPPERGGLGIKIVIGYDEQEEGIEVR